MQLKITFIALVAIAALAVGCGGGSDSSGGGTANGAADSGAGSTDTTSIAGDGDGGSTEAADGGDDSAPLPKAQFVKRADAICQLIPSRYTALVQELEKKAEAQGKPKPTTAEANLKAAVPPLSEAAEEIEDLAPPTGDEKEIDTIIDALEAAAKGLEAKPSSELTGPKSPFDDFQTLAGEYGLNGCSAL